MRSIPIWSLLILVFAWGAVGAWQTQQTARVVTKDGETIEGTFEGASDTALSMRVDGEVVEVPIERVDYLSFFDPMEMEDDSMESEEATPLDRAFEAFWELHSAIEEDTTRDEYASKFRETMPAVSAYIESPTEDWPELRDAMKFALAKYREALNSDQWEQTGASDVPPVHRLLDHAAGAVEFAGYLLSDSTPNHMETEYPRKIAVGATLQGRLGRGDTLMSADLDGSSSGAYNDVFTFRLDSPARVAIYVESIGPMTPHITLVDGQGRKLITDAGIGAEARSLKSLTSSGEYSIWVGAAKPGEVGLYEIALELDSE